MRRCGVLAAEMSTAAPMMHGRGKMSISITIFELDAPDASCRTFKKELVNVLVDDISGFEDVAEYDDVVGADSARALFPDWEAFLKRNRLSEDTEAVYLDRIKNDDDIALLRTHAERISTGWIAVSGLDAGRLDTALSRSKEENRINKWDMISFEEMTETCAACPLSWDKGRGCIGSFGPQDSALPAIAAKRGCRIVASVPEGASSKRVYTPEEGAELIREVEILAAALPEEGKIFVRNYKGCLERLKAVAEVSVKEGCGFYFF